MAEDKETKAAPTYSVKTSKDITDEVDKLVGLTGLSNKDLFATMVMQFKTNLMASPETEQTEDMQQIKYHLTHAESIFTNMVQKLHDLKQNFSESIGQEKILHQGIVDQVEKSRLQTESERDKARLELAEIQDRMKEISERNNELEAIQRSNHITVELLTNRNELMEARIGTVAEMENEVQQLRTKYAETQHKNEKLQTEADQNMQILELTKERLASIEKEKEQAISALRQSHEKEIAQIAQAQANELASTQKMADLQMHASTIEATNRVLEVTDKLKDEYTDRIDTLQGRIQTLTARVHELELNKPNKPVRG